ncbi:molybdate ABC transporter substrate-binding protein [Kineococcus glutinatus]|uniref:Molybdate ABC transporter substrate-binding protein n=1 Tax=Kineococcus glutinatus TaxID=1070872 RepID=A0ABP8VGH0_9ACTN
MRNVTTAAVAAALLAACGPATGPSSSPSSSPSGAGTLTVFAAASLTATFTEIGTRFEAAHPGVEVEFAFAGSSDLVTQITAGAPADVFAAADERTMQKVVDAGSVAGGPVAFATNTLQIVTPPDDPAGVAGVADLARPGVDVVVCAPQVPCGAATRLAEEAAGVDVRPVSEESSVTDVLGKVTSGQADAGVVYVTDAIAAGDAVRAVPFPEAAQAVNTYPVAALREARDAELAAAFTAFVAGPEGRQVLAAAGIGAPGAP